MLYLIHVVDSDELFILHASFGVELFGFDDQEEFFFKGLISHKANCHLFPRFLQWHGLYASPRPVVCVEAVLKDQFVLKLVDHFRHFFMFHCLVY